MLRKRLHPVSTNNPVDLFTNVPQEITIDIVSRLPVGSIVRCKCVCKSWRNLIESSEFVTTHLSKSTSSSGLALIDQDVESLNPNYRLCNEVGVDGCTTISNFVLPTYPRTTELCSANGLLLLFDGCTLYDHNLFVCNPITREYIRVPLPPVYEPCKAIFGFGASKVTGEYKVVIICKEGMLYSLQTGLWRSIAAPILTHDRVATAAALLNGNLHWLGVGCGTKLVISCFDLETEQFTSFHLPPCDYDGRYYLSALEGRLCFSDNVDHDKIVIWFMNIYGDGNAWTKEYIINTSSLNNHLNCRKFSPVKVFRDSGDILFEVECCEQLFFYSNETKSIREYAGNLQVRASYTSSIVSCSPSFLSLKAMGLKNVASIVA